MESGPVKAGDLFQGYRIIKLLGRGGYASVYHARREFIGRDVAIKISNRSVTREVFKRFQAEARFTHSLEHPNIVKVDDADMAGGHLYIVMELLHGQTFWDARKQYGKLTVPEALHLCAQVADGVEQAHRAGAIHRDLKPLNLFIVAGNQPKVLDFGIAKIPDDGDGSSTQRNIVHGTLKYMSPYQLMGKKPTPHSDIYALGVILFELITARHPHIAENAQPTEAELGFAIVSSAPATLDSVDSSIPRYIVDLVECALSKDPEKRFASMAEFATAMRECHARYVREFPQLAELRNLWVPAPTASMVVRSAPPPDQEQIATAVVAAVPPQSLRPTVRVPTAPEPQPEPSSNREHQATALQVPETPPPVGGGVAVGGNQPQETRSRSRGRAGIPLRRVLSVGGLLGFVLGAGLTVARLSSLRSPPSSPSHAADRAPLVISEAAPVGSQPRIAVTLANEPKPIASDAAPHATALPSRTSPAPRPLADRAKARAPKTDTTLNDRFNWFRDDNRKPKPLGAGSGL